MTSQYLPPLLCSVDSLINFSFGQKNSGNYYHYCFGFDFSSESLLPFSDISPTSSCILPFLFPWPHSPLCVLCVLLSPSSILFSLPVVSFCLIVKNLEAVFKGKEAECVYLLFKNLLITLRGGGHTKLQLRAFILRIYLHGIKPTVSGMIALLSALCDSNQ